MQYDVEKMKNRFISICKDQHHQGQFESILFGQFKMMKNETVLWVMSLDLKFTINNP